MVIYLAPHVRCQLVINGRSCIPRVNKLANSAMRCFQLGKSHSVACDLNEAT